MELEVNYVNISRMAWSDRTYVADGQLNICKQEVIDLVKEDSRFIDVQVELALPGESVRIVAVKDVIEPRVKLDEMGGYFGGVLSPVDSTGCGRTLVLSGSAVVLSGPLMDYMEAIIDMTGAGAPYTPFSSTCNVVLSLKTTPGIGMESYKQATHMAGVKAAVYLASHAKDSPPDRVKTYRWQPVLNGLPRVAHIHMLMNRGPQDHHLYGSDVAGILPTVITPLAAIDGAIGNVSCRSSGHRNTTYHHQNNPVVIEALERHLRDINFAGVVVTLERTSHAEKERNSTLATTLASMLNLDGAIVTEENKGNPDVDLMMVCRKSEKLGIKTVLMTDECAGQDGMCQGLADTTPEADAVVTNGNSNGVVILPPMGKVIGDIDAVGKLGGTFSDSILSDGSLRVEVVSLCGACNELGYGTFTCVME